MGGEVTGEGAGGGSKGGGSGGGGSSGGGAGGSLPNRSRKNGTSSLLGCMRSIAALARSRVRPKKAMGSATANLSALLPCSACMLQCACRNACFRSALVAACSPGSVLWHACRSSRRTVRTPNWARLCRSSCGGCMPRRQPLLSSMSPAASAVQASADSQPDSCCRSVSAVKPLC